MLGFLSDRHVNTGRISVKVHIIAFDDKRIYLHGSPVYESWVKRHNVKLVERRRPVHDYRSFGRFRKRCLYCDWILLLGHLASLHRGIPKVNEAANDERFVDGHRHLFRNSYLIQAELRIRNNRCSGREVLWAREESALEKAGLILHTLDLL